MNKKVFSRVLLQRRRLLDNGPWAIWTRNSNDKNSGLLSLLLGHTDGSASSTSGLGMLTSDSDSPEVSKTSVKSHLLHSFDIFTNLGVNSVGNKLLEFSFLVVLLSVEHPVRDVVLSGVGHDGNNFVDFVIGEFTGSIFRSENLNN